MKFFNKYPNFFTLEWWFCYRKNQNWNGGYWALAKFPLFGLAKIYLWFLAFIYDFVYDEHKDEKTYYEIEDINGVVYYKINTDSKITKY